MGDREAKKGPHGGSDLSEQGYCCGGDLFICADCGHKGMEGVGGDPMSQTDEEKCPKCGHIGEVSVRSYPGVRV